MSLDLKRKIVAAAAEEVVLGSHRSRGTIA